MKNVGRGENHIGVRSRAHFKSFFSTHLLADSPDFPYKRLKDSANELKARAALSQVSPTLGGVLCRQYCNSMHLEQVSCPSINRVSLRRRRMSSCDWFKVPMDT